MTKKDFKNISETMRVLYVEDSKSSQIILRETLSDYFPKLEVCDNGEEGLAAYKNHSHDIIITDVMMPKMNGIEMIKEIKKIHDHQNIIVVSAYDNTDILLPLLNLGVDRFIQKPIKVNFLLAVLSKVCLEIQTLKNKNKVQRLLKESNDEIKEIFNNYTNAVFVVNNSKLGHANVQALDLSEEFSRTGLQYVLDNLGNFLKEEVGYLYAKNISDLIEKSLNSPEELHQIKILIGENEKIFKYTIEKMDALDKYMFVMNDITEFSKITHLNPITELPNSIAINNKIEMLCESNSPFSVVLLSIENVNQIKKWHGSHSIMLAEIKIAKNFKFYLLTTKIKYFFANFSKNSFIFIIKNEDVSFIESMISSHSHLVSYKQNSKSKNQKIKIKFKVNTLEFHTNNFDYIIKEITETFERMHL